jgi:hypothetical protein
MMGGNAAQLFRDRLSAVVTVWRFFSAVMSPSSFTPHFSP